MNQAGLKNATIGDTYVGFCIIRKIELRKKKDGALYLNLELGDISGRIGAKIWNNGEELFDRFKVKDVVKIKGTIQTFYDRKEIHIEKIRLAQNDEFVLEKLVPTSKKNIQKLMEGFRQHYRSIDNSHLKKLLEKLFPDEQKWNESFKSPSGKLWHHNYLFGTLEHIVSMLDVADSLLKHYPDLNADLLKCGIILHNLGKESEYLQDGYIDFSTEGRLLGHIVLGYQQVKESIDELENFPETLRLQILHFVLSHQGGPERGSPVVPMTAEAIALHLIDDLDAKMNAVQRISENDRLPESNWTRYNNLLERFIYLPENDSEKEVDKHPDKTE